MRDDLKAALRSLRSSTTFAAVALTVLALGIGASTAIFSVVDAVVLRGLPFDEHDRLVAVGERRPPGPLDTTIDPLAISSIAAPNYLDWAAQQQVFESMAAIVGPPFSSFTLREPGGEPEDLVGFRVTADFFKVLRIRPALGRTFTSENEVEGRHRVAVLSDAFWQRRFGGNHDIIGRTIALDDGASEVIGILPPDVTYPVGAIRSTDVFAPNVIPARERIRDPNGRVMIMRGIARLKPGVSIAQAQAQMDQIAAALEKANPVWNKDNKVGVRPLRDYLVGARTKSWLLMLLGTVAMVLLIACANVANLLLARASAREREVAVRAALGASRWRLVRQLMVESLVLSAAGTVIAMLLAWWAVGILRNSMPEGVARVAAIAVNMRVFAAASGLALVCALLFGVVPAVQQSRPDLNTALKDTTRGASAGRGRQQVRGALVVVEVALAVVLLVGAALFIGSFLALMRIDPGFSIERVLVAQVSPRGDLGKRAPEIGTALAQIIERVSQIRGVVSASAIFGGLPLRTGTFITNISVPGKQLAGSDADISLRVVTTRYHETLRIPLERGRLFEATDQAGSASVAIINESAARKYFPSEDPVGRTINISNEARTIVGVVGDIHQSSLETAPRAEAYIPIAQARAFGGDLVIRTSADPHDALPAVRTAVAAVLPNVPLRNVTTMEELLARQVAQRRLNMLLLGLFGLLGLVISGVGIYGVVAYLVSQRTREIGVRMALGATGPNVVWMVLGNISRLIVAGLTVGSVGAWSLRATAQKFLFGLEATDLRAFAAALVLLASAALIAAAVPAKRAARLDPMVALRAE